LKTPGTGIGLPPRFSRLSKSPGATGVSAGTFIGVLASKVGITATEDVFWADSDVIDVAVAFDHAG
jgi:hypothetical protein